VGKDPTQAYEQAQGKIKNLIKKISSFSSVHEMSSSHPLSINSCYESDVSDEAFVQLVEQAQDYIKKGDAFQIVLSRCFKKNYHSKPFDIYRALRQVSPAPYMFYLPLKDRVIVGASPERMVSVYQRQVSINPIAGTRRRLDQEQDQKMEQELLCDEKELAEHRMLVDLARNDLGRVCDIGSIRVEELTKVKHYSHVSHITSIVTGTLAKSYDFLDAFAASFPAGTLSGAPKIRAMQIIDELEHSRRGLYGGAIGRLDGAGNFESCIAIRMASLKDGVATIRTGAGIVHGSNPQAEAEETHQKASSLLAAINFAEGRDL
jgi:anthranilate synthase component 1